MGNKKEKLEMCSHLQGYDAIGVKEMWQDGSYDWQGSQGGCVTLYVNDQLECIGTLPGER